MLKFILYTMQVPAYDNKHYSISFAVAVPV
jgi:hypothetical protein